MSTKTTFKRIALVAVAALGLGVLTSVAPASAVTTITSVSVGTPGAARAGGTSLIPVTFNFASDSSDTFVVGARIQTAPATSNAINMTAATVTGSNVLSITADGSGNIQYTADATDSYTQVGGASAAAVNSEVTIGSTAATSATVNFNFTPDVSGTYTFLFWAGGTTWAASYAQATGSVTTAGAPASITITKISSTIPDTDTTNGAVVAVTLKDAAGTATRLAAGESLTISDSSSETTIQAGPATGGATITSFGAGDDYLAGGTYYARIVSADGSAADATVTLTVAGSGGLIPATITTNTTLSVVDVDAATPVSAIALTSTTGYSTTGISGTVDYVTAKSSHGFTVTATADADSDVKYPVVITLGNGIVVASTVSFLEDATTAKLTVSAAVALTDLNAVKVQVDDQNLEFSFAAPAAASIAVVGASSVLSATAGATTWAIQAVDQFAVGMQYVPVSVAVAGRNTVVTKSIGVTDADGFITYTHKDAGTTGTTDTLTFSSTGLASVTGTVTYGTVTVAKVSFTGGSTTAGVANATVTTNPIKAGDTPEDSEVPAVVTLTDASGNLLAGVPVTFTVSGTGAAINSTTATVYSNSAGKATSGVYAWLAGTYTVTATAGGVTGTGSYTFANSDATTARIISAKAEGGIVTATVVDRFGNPVSGVMVYASKTGTGYFGSGVSKLSSSTGVDGTVEFSVVGVADVKLSTLDYNAVPGTNAPGQTCALAGNLDCAVGTTAATAFTATTAGTATVAAANVGSTYAPAGVSTVTVAVNNDSASAAADAAAEATDAANAATDAANAAAEAADAATAAAQDAADAVAALSTQVSEMVNALKKQITALTNLVIKIQKKVKA